MSRSRKRKHTKYNYGSPSNTRPSVPKPTISHSVSKDLTKDKSPKVERNTFGDVTYSMQYVGDEKFEYWITYDESRRPLSYKDTRGQSWNCKYNSKGNIANYWDYSGYQEDYRYYINNIVICTTSFGEKIKKRIKTDKFITRDTFILSDSYI